MPYRKAKIEARFDDAIAKLLHANERVEAGTLGMRGLGYYWRGIGATPVYVSVTNERILFIDGSLFGVRPEGVYLEEPRRDDAVVGMKRELDLRLLGLWTTRVRYRKSSGEILSLHFNSHWDDRNVPLLAALTPTGPVSPSSDA